MLHVGHEAPLCPVCGAGRLEPFYSLGTVPAHVGAIWPTREDARDCPRGELTLAHCAICDLVHNVAFDPGLADYSAPYDNSLHFSEVFQRYERDLARRLIARYGVRDADVVEIGCGSGHFLGLLCELGGNRGVGYDPSFDPASADPLLAGRARVEREYFSAAHAARPADLIVCRHVLEHLPDPAGFLRQLRAGIGDERRPAVYLEVPNGLLALRRLSVADLIYEHCSYFVAGSLRRVLEEAGFEVLDLHEAYDGQFLGVEARPARHATPRASRSDDSIAGDVQAFPARARERTAAWRALLEDVGARAGRAVAWGAGAKAVGFFNLLDIDDEIECVVDLNPRKQGAHLAGTGQRIVSPEDLVERPPEAVIVMNPVYAGEIGSRLRRMGIGAEVVCVGEEGA